MESIVEVESRDEEYTEGSTEIVALEPLSNGFDVQGHIHPHTLGMAIAHVSAQTTTLADAQYHLQYRQSHQMFQQQQYVEARVEQARAEANARSLELAHFIQQNQVNPAQIDYHITARIRAAMEETRNETATRDEATSQLQARLQLGVESKITDIGHALTQIQATSEHQSREQISMVHKLNAVSESVAHVQLASEEQMQVNQSLTGRITTVETALTQFGTASEQQLKAQKAMETRLTAALQQAQTAVISTSEQRTKELLGAYFKHHAAQTKVAIGAEVRQTAQILGDHITALESRVTTHMENSAKLSEKRARAAVRRHLAHENQGLNELEQKLLQAIADSEERAVQRAQNSAKTLVDGLVTRQLEDAATLGITSSDVASSIVSRVIEQPRSTPSVLLTEDEFLSDDDESFQILDVPNDIGGISAIAPKSTRAVVAPMSNQVQNNTTDIRTPPQRYQQVVISEQQKVMARALSRAKTLRRSSNSKSMSSSPKKKGYSTKECVAMALKLREKRKAKAARWCSANKE